jgi:two-component system LytT family response regulator
MQEIKAVIVDDEDDSRMVLRSLLSKFCKNVLIVGEADNPDAAYLTVQATKPDLVFLDIQMPLSSGFDLLKRFQAIPFEVIFVTSYDKYAINAIKFSALDYLLKPVEVTDLKVAVERATAKRYKEQQANLQVSNLMNLLKSAADDKEIAVHYNESVHLVKIASIILIEADGRYCNLHTESSGKHTMAKTLKEFELLLAGNESFVRINKSCLINKRFITRYSKQAPFEIELAGGKLIEISRRKRQEVIQLLNLL